MKLLLVLWLSLALAGCANTASSKKTYAPANFATRLQLLKDLETGKLKQGATVKDVRSAYGEADAMAVRLYGGTDLQYTHGRRIIFLHFSDNKHLSSWKH